VYSHWGVRGMHRHAGADPVHSSPAAYTPHPDDSVAIRTTYSQCKTMLIRGGSTNNIRRGRYLVGGEVLGANNCH